MANQKEFAEGIRSYRTRLETELRAMLGNIDGFDDPRNQHEESLRILVQHFHRSLMKAETYLVGIEGILGGKIERVINNEKPEADNS